MAITTSLYNHTAALFASGDINDVDDFRLMLCTAATFNAADTTLAGITKTEVATANGYIAGGKILSNVVVSTVTTNDASFDADDVTWTASGGSIAASYGILYNDSLSSDEPLLFIDFGGTQTAVDGADFVVIWNANGIFSFTVA